MAPAVPDIAVLLNLVPEAPSSVLNALTQHPTLAARCDGNGYSLLHAAVSYNHLDLARALIKDFNVDPNIVDMDGETCLYNVETVEAAECAVEQGTSITWKNHEGKTAEERLREDDEFPEVVAYLQQAQASRDPASIAVNGSTSSESTLPPPPLPDGVQISVGTMDEQSETADGDPDPEFRRRIEELAQRDDFQGEDGQRELRALIEDAIGGLKGDQRNTRQRTE
jgi:uncharacterized protein